MELILNVDSTKPLQMQFFDEIRGMILDGRLAAGIALPPTRNLAQRYGVSRNTVTLTYDRLVAEGYVEPRSTKVELDINQWHQMVDLQGRLAEYLRVIALPED